MGPLAFTDGEVDGASRAGCQRDEDGLPSFAEHGEGPMAAFEAELFDVGPDRFGDPQTVECQRRERMFG